MKTFLSIIGVIALIILVWYLGFKKGLMLNLFSSNAAGNNSSKCDPARSGWNLDGFPDIDCGFGG